MVLLALLFFARRADAAARRADARRPGRGGACSAWPPATGRARIAAFLVPATADPLGAGVPGHARRCTRSPTAACSAWGSARAGRSGATCPTPTTTSSSRSSARSWASSGRSRCSRCSRTLAYTGLRIAARNIDPWLRIVVATSTTWLVAQAAINIGYVVGLLPVTGIPLPLISSGGTSLVVTMFVFGVLANAARHEPEARRATLTRGGRGAAAGQRRRPPAADCRSRARPVPGRTLPAPRSDARAARNRPAPCGPRSDRAARRVP